MGFLARIPTSFPDLLSRLGVTISTAAGLPFDLVGSVLPVAIVDPDPLQAVSVEIVRGTPFTQGEIAAPAADTLLADTLALAAGNYNVLIIVGTAGESQQVSVRLQRRNAANNANVWATFLSAGGSQAGIIFSFRCTLLLDERLRIISGPTAAAAGSIWQASIWAAV